MDAVRWREISDLVAAVADATHADREALLASRPDLRAEIESLLRYVDEGSGPLDGPNVLLLPSMAGREIGAYRVIRELAQGGMGVVLLARRAGVDFDQQVAIKLARISLQSEFFARRFLEERQILARLDHPNIARLLDGGLTADGTPYLVMPYIEGEPLDSWCANRSLDLRARIDLFLKVCAAVEYAHEHLVVHRDLKPTNILVTVSGEPMLLDFGMARLVQAAEATGANRTALPLVTLRYASPEQLGGLTGSTRSDVYALSVILYELLTGCWPYADDPSESTPVRIRIITEQDAIPPSRSGAPGASRLAGDLDAILLKGLEKRPERRYGTVAQMSDDLRRFLASEPVSARPATWTYRGARFVLRHRVAALTGAVIVATLAAATAISVRNARVANDERARAEEVGRFVERLLGASRPGEVTPLATRGRDLRVVDVIDDAARTVGEEFKDRPDVETGLRSTIGSTYMALGEYDKARPHVEVAVVLAERAYGGGHLATARALTARGRLRIGAGDFAGAREDLERSLAIEERRAGPNATFIHGLLGEATLRLGDPRASLRHLQAALVGMRREFGTHHVATATMINNVGVVAEDTGDQAVAERHFREAADVLRGLPGPPPNLLHPLIGLQRAHFYRGEFPAAKAICEEAYQVAIQQSGEESRNAATAMVVLATVKAHLGEADAEVVIRRAIDVQRRVYPTDHYEIARGLTGLGRVLLRRDKAAEAEGPLREALRIGRLTFPKDNWRTAEARVFLGASLAAQGRRDEARAAFTEGLREMEAVLPAAHPRVHEARGLAANSDPKN
jgi:serine/threonine-protein kinase